MWDQIVSDLPRCFEGCQIIVTITTETIFPHMKSMRILSLCTRNEVRMANGVFASWGNGKRNDWALAAEKLGNLILGKGHKTLQKLTVKQHFLPLRQCNNDIQERRKNVISLRHKFITEFIARNHPHSFLGLCRDNCRKCPALPQHLANK